MNHPRIGTPTPAPPGGEDSAEHKDTHEPFVLRSTLLLFRVVGQGGPDMAASRADARIALCIERGVALDDIDPSLGYDHSERAYASVRGQHVDRLASRPGDCWVVRDALQAYFAWRRARPDLAGNDNWFADADRASPGPEPRP
ncbi:MAG: hypothetical protein HOV68_05480 [Streptomycetaceae bacterium]|nr:hypothetical protein [Streptomycetaceae bacterium]